MRRRRRGRRALPAAAVLGCLLGGTAPAGAAAPAPPAGAPLPGAVSVAGGSWVVVPMGHLDDPLNTFWQVLSLPAGARRWRLVTPPGVADNGGVAVAAGPVGGTATVGFDPSQLLRFSPLAITSDAGAHWSTGLVPEGLSAVPDSLGVTAAGAPALALVARGTRVLAARNATSWSTSTTVGALGAAAPACRPGLVTAVTSGAGGVAVAGTSCRNPGRVGLFERSPGGTWRDTAGPGLVAPGTAATVVRVAGTPAGTVALAATRSAGADGLLALRRSAAGGWTPTAVATGRSARLLSTAVGPAGALLAMVRTGGRTVLLADPPGRPWRTLPSPPAGTLAVATAGPAVEAFVVAGTRLSVLGLGAGGSSWVPLQTMQVQLAYGSSG